MYLIPQGRSLRAGIVGFGFAGQTFHAPVIAGVPGLHLAAIASSQPEKVRAAWPHVDVEPAAAGMFNRDDIDLVVIAAPNEAHFGLAEAALLAGKHVVVDKPFTVNLAQAQALEALATSRGLVLSVYQNRRYDADYLTLHDVLASGELGRVVFFESHFDRYRPQVRTRWRELPGPGAGLWLDLGSHLLDQTVQLFGRPDAIFADMAPLRDGAGTEDYFHVQLRYDGGAHPGLRVILQATTLAAAAAPRFRVHGTRGSYVKDGVDPQEDALKAGARPHWDGLDGWGLDTQPGELATSPDGVSVVARKVPGRPGNYLAYYAAVRDAILGKAGNPVTPAEAVQVMALLALGQESAARRIEVPVPRA